MGTGCRRKGRRAHLAAVAFISLWLAGCGAASLVGGAATATGQALKTTGKAVGVVARASIGGAKAVGRVATKPFRKGDPPPAPPEEPSMPEPVFKR